MLEFVTAVGSVILFKFSSSLDDCIWLPPLIAKEKKSYRLILGMVYLLTLSFIVLAAYFVNQVGIKFFAFFDLNKAAFSLFSSLFLVFFALWKLKKGDEDFDRKGDTLLSKITATFLMTVVGSIDEFTSFIIVMNANRFTLVNMLLGTLIAGIVILLGVEAIKKIPYFDKILNLNSWYIILLLAIFFSYLACRDLFSVV